MQRKLFRHGRRGENAVDRLHVEWAGDLAHIRRALVFFLILPPGWV
jgi:hypothetical protein